ncbi:hypothetical protein BHE74_00013758 [Ensete ventricosum]|nr:hypothetical protein BHE74_00013758 [Ensete ventricosum]
MLQSLTSKPLSMASGASAFFLYPLSNDSFYDRLSVTAILFRQLSHSSVEASLCMRSPSSCTTTDAPPSTLTKASASFLAATPTVIQSHRCSSLAIPPHRHATVPQPFLYSLSNDSKSSANCWLHSVVASSSSPLQLSLPSTGIISSNFCRSLQPMLLAALLLFHATTATLGYSPKCRGQCFAAASPFPTRLLASNRSRDMFSPGGSNHPRWSLPQPLLAPAAALAAHSHGLLLQPPSDLAAIFRPALDNAQSAQPFPPRQDQLLS